MWKLETSSADSPTADCPATKRLEQHIFAYSQFLDLSTREKQLIYFNHFNEIVDTHYLKQSVFMHLIICLEGIFKIALFEGTNEGDHAADRR